MDQIEKDVGQFVKDELERISLPFKAKAALRKSNRQALRRKMVRKAFTEVVTDTVMNLIGWCLFIATLVSLYELGVFLLQ